MEDQKTSQAMLENSNEELELANTSDIIEIKELVFEENQLVEDATSECTPYGCTCISHEKCCGCILQ